MKLLKGVTVSVFLFLLCIVAPFNIHAAGETQIVPTYTSSTTQQEWQTKIRVTNYCEGTNASTASCKLSFYVTGNYYGIIYVDGYDSANTHWMNGTSIFVSGGYGEYNYNFYQNGIKAISSISIWAVSLVEPDSNVDLSQIISLLTSINSYEQQNNLLLDDVVDNTDTVETNQLENIQQIKNVISQLIVSNGYLETLTKIRQFDIPFESLLIVTYFNSYHDPVDLYLSDVYDSKYPIYKMNGRSFRLYGYSGHQYKMIILSKSSTSGHFNQNFSITPNPGFSLSSSLYSGDTYFFRQSYLYLMTYTFTCTSTGNYFFDYVGSDESYYVIPIYYGDINDKTISTDFALRYGLSNQLLDDIHLIANGSSQSNQQSQELSSGTDSMQQQMNDLVGVEDSYNQQFNNSVNSIDFSNPLQQNQGLLGASNFVITVFNGLIANNPFSILIIIVCILLIGKKVIGK